MLSWRRLDWSIWFLISMLSPTLPGCFLTAIFVKIVPYISVNSQVRPIQTFGQYERLRIFFVSQITIVQNCNYNRGKCIIQRYIIHASIDLSGLYCLEILRIMVCKLSTGRFDYPPNFRHIVCYVIKLGKLQGWNTIIY